MTPKTINFLRNVTASTLRSVNAPGRRRIASAMHRILGPNPGLHEASLRGGGRILIDSDRNLDVFYLGEHDPHVSSFLRRIVRNGDVILDVGARFGEYTVPLSLATGPTGRVFALEALQANYEILCRNLRLNGLTNVTAVQTAVLDRTTELDAPVRTDPGNYSLAANATGRTRLPACSLDDFCSSRQIDQVGLMVIDIEGSETLAFRGARRMLSSGRIRNVVCEVNSGWLRRMGSSADELYGEFQSCGLKVSLLNRFGRLSALDPATFARLTNRGSKTTKLDVVLQPRVSEA